MIDALSGMVCFVTVAISFLYGTRIAWVCGKECDFKAKPEDKIHTISERIPAAAVVYFFGFLIIFSLCIDGLLTVVVSSLTSSILLSGFVVSMAIPELKFKSTTK